MAYIEWLGIGSGLNFSEHNTAFLLKGDFGNLLVDCGITIPKKLYESGLLDEIYGVVLTHAHSDHAGGLPDFGSYHYFVKGGRGKARPRLYLASDKTARELWDKTLRGGMENMVDLYGKPVKATLETYFDVHTGTTIDIKGFPEIEFLKANHVPGLDCGGLFVGDRIYYSGDNRDMPPADLDLKLIFQDCQLHTGPNNGVGDVHATYDRLKKLDKKTKAITYLVHYGKDWRNADPAKDGFAGFVRPGDKFDISETCRKI